MTHFGEREFERLPHKPTYGEMPDDTADPQSQPDDGYNYFDEDVEWDDRKKPGMESTSPAGTSKPEYGTGSFTPAVSQAVGETAVGDTADNAEGMGDDPDVGEKPVQEKDPPKGGVAAPKETSKEVAPLPAPRRPRAETVDGVVMGDTYDSTALLGSRGELGGHRKVMMHAADPDTRDTMTYDVTCTAVAKLAANAQAVGAAPKGLVVDVSLAAREDPLVTTPADDVLRRHGHVVAMDPVAFASLLEPDKLAAAMGHAAAAAENFRGGDMAYTNQLTIVANAMSKAVNPDTGQPHGRVEPWQLRDAVRLLADYREDGSLPELQFGDVKLPSYLSQAALSAQADPVIRANAPVYQGMIPFLNTAVPGRPDEPGFETSADAAELIRGVTPDDKVTVLYAQPDATAAHATYRAQTALLTAAVPALLAQKAEPGSPNLEKPDLVVYDEMNATNDAASLAETLRLSQSRRLPLAATLGGVNEATMPLLAGGTHVFSQVAPGSHTTAIASVSGHAERSRLTGYSENVGANLGGNTGQSDGWNFKNAIEGPETANRGETSGESDGLSAGAAKSFNLAESTRVTGSEIAQTPPSHAVVVPSDTYGQVELYNLRDRQVEGLWPPPQDDPFPDVDPQAVIDAVRDRYPELQPPRQVIEGDHIVEGPGAGQSLTQYQQQPAARPQQPVQRQPAQQQPPQLPPRQQRQPQLPPGQFSPRAPQHPQQPALPARPTPARGRPRAPEGLQRPEPTTPNRRRQEFDIRYNRYGYDATTRRRIPRDEFAGIEYWHQFDRGETTLDQNEWLRHWGLTEYLPRWERD